MKSTGLLDKQKWQISCLICHFDGWS